MVSPVSGIEVGTPVYEPRRGRGSDASSDLVRITNRRGSSGPIAGDVYVPKSVLMNIGNGEVAYKGAFVVADGDLTPTSPFVRVRVLESTEAPDTDGFVATVVFEALTSGGPVTAGKLYLVARSSVIWIDDKYAFVPVIAIQDFPYRPLIVGEVV